MEEDVKDCFHGEVSDVTLGMIVNLTVASLFENRPLFPNPLEEPYFYKTYIKTWVREEIDMDRAIANKQVADIRALGALQN